MNRTTLQTAFPYVFATTATALVGLNVALKVSSIALQVLGHLMLFIGIYSLFAVIRCTVKNFNNPQKFIREVEEDMVGKIFEQIAMTCFHFFSRSIFPFPFHLVIFTKFSKIFI